jgi:hypothetical protein
MRRINEGKALTTNTTRPQVFIIESLGLGDEKKDRFEGRVLKHILALGGKNSSYYYIRTRRELEKIVVLFGKSRFRYLHISCHGNPKEMVMTFDRITFSELGKILRPHLHGRRVFLSACEMTTGKLADELLLGSGCYSVIGPVETVYFSDAALLWSSFYHLVFRTNDAVMRRKTVLAHLRSTATLFSMRMNYFSASKRKGVRHVTVAPLTD